MQPPKFNYSCLHVYGCGYLLISGNTSEEMTPSLPEIINYHTTSFSVIGKESFMIPSPTHDRPDLCKPSAGTTATMSL